MCVCVCVKAMASKITCIVQGGHPENILERDGTFLGQEALLGKGKARLSHTLTHTPVWNPVNRKWATVLPEPTDGFRGFRDFRPADGPSCVPSAAAEVCGILETWLASFTSKTRMSLYECGCVCMCMWLIMMPLQAHTLTHTHR